MIEVKIDCVELQKLIKKCEGFPEVFTDARREAIDIAGKNLKEQLDKAIGGTGRVAGWQEVKYGSRGGYVAVRPRRGDVESPEGKDTPYAIGYVTNAINSGHKTRGHRGKFNRVFKGEFKKGADKVPGKHFYEDTKAEKLDKAIENALKQIEDAINRYLEE